MNNKRSEGTCCICGKYSPVQWTCEECSKGYVKAGDHIGSATVVPDGPPRSSPQYRATTAVTMQIVNEAIEYANMVHARHIEAIMKSFYERGIVGCCEAWIHYGFRLQFSEEVEKPVNFCPWCGAKK